MRVTCPAHLIDLIVLIIFVSVNFIDVKISIKSIIIPTHDSEDLETTKYGHGPARLGTKLFCAGEVQKLDDRPTTNFTYFRQEP
jgi:hypothetical protein